MHLPWVFWYNVSCCKCLYGMYLFKLTEKSIASNFHVLQVSYDYVLTFVMFGFFFFFCLFQGNMLVSSGVKYRLGNDTQDRLDCHCVNLGLPLVAKLQWWRPQPGFYPQSREAIEQMEDESVNWASSRQNLSSGFVTRVVSNWPAQVQRLARGLKFPI